MSTPSTHDDSPAHQAEHNSQAGQTPPASVTDLPCLGYENLFGYTPDDITLLRAHSDDARNGLLTYTQWKTAHHEVLARTPAGLVKLPTPENLEALHHATWDAALTQLRNDIANKATPDGKYSDTYRHWMKLSRDLRTLAGPPTPTQIEAELLELLELIKDPPGAYQPTDADRRELRAVRSWALELDLRDPKTGLPRQLIEAHRTVPVAVLGSMPCGAYEAQLRAWRTATPEQRAAASRHANGPAYTTIDTHVYLQSTAMKREALAAFLTYARSHDSDAARQLTALWNDGSLPALLRDHYDDLADL